MGEWSIGALGTTNPQNWIVVENPADHVNNPTFINGALATAAGKGMGDVYLAPGQNAPILIDSPIFVPYGMRVHGFGPMTAKAPPAASAMTPGNVYGTVIMAGPNWTEFTPSSRYTAGFDYVYDSAATWTTASSTVTDAAIVAADAERPFNFPGHSATIQLYVGAGANAPTPGTSFVATNGSNTPTNPHTGHQVGAIIGSCAPISALVVLCPYSIANSPWQTVVSSGPLPAGTGGGNGCFNMTLAGQYYGGTATANYGLLHTDQGQFSGDLLILDTNGIGWYALDGSGDLTGQGVQFANITVNNRQMGSVAGIMGQGDIISAGGKRAGATANSIVGCTTTARGTSQTMTGTNDTLNVASLQSGNATDNFFNPANAITPNTASFTVTTNNGLRTVTYTGLTTTAGSAAFTGCTGFVNGDTVAGGVTVTGLITRWASNFQIVVNIAQGDQYGTLSPMNSGCSPLLQGESGNCNGSAVFGTSIPASTFLDVGGTVGIAKGWILLTNQVSVSTALGDITIIQPDRIGASMHLGASDGRGSNINLSQGVATLSGGDTEIVLGQFTGAQLLALSVTQTGGGTVNVGVSDVAISNQCHLSAITWGPGGGSGSAPMGWWRFDDGGQVLISGGEVESANTAISTAVMFDNSAAGTTFGVTVMGTLLIQPATAGALGAGFSALIFNYSGSNNPNNTVWVPSVGANVMENSISAVASYFSGGGMFGVAAGGGLPGSYFIQYGGTSTGTSGYLTSTNATVTLTTNASTFVMPTNTTWRVTSVGGGGGGGGGGAGTVGQTTNTGGGGGGSGASVTDIWKNTGAPLTVTATIPAAATGGAVTAAGAAGGTVSATATGQTGLTINGAAATSGTVGTYALGGSPGQGAANGSTTVVGGGFPGQTITSLATSATISFAGCGGRSNLGSAARAGYAATGGAGGSTSPLTSSGGGGGGAGGFPGSGANATSSGGAGAGTGSGGSGTNGVAGSGANGGAGGTAGANSGGGGGGGGGAGFNGGGGGQGVAGAGGNGGTGVVILEQLG